METSRLAPRLHRLPGAIVAGCEVRIAVGVRARLLGLAFLDREEAGAGLLIPHCASVHTFGMRFALDLVFIDARGEALAANRRVPPRRLVSHRRAVAVLEIPSSQGGEIAPPPDLEGPDAAPAT